MKMVEKILIMAVIVGSIFLGGCFTNDPTPEDLRPPLMNNTPFTNFVPSSELK